MIKKFLKFLGGCREVCESDDQIILAGYLMPCKLHKYVGVGELLVDEMVINSWVDILCSMKEEHYKKRGIELMEFISKKNAETPEIPQIRRFRMSIVEAKYYLRDAENLPMQSLLIDEP